MEASAMLEAIVEILAFVKILEYSTIKTIFKALIALLSLSDFVTIADYGDILIC